MKENRKEFKSSSDDKKVYITETHSDGSVNCTCPGFQYRQNCKHVEELKNEN